MTDKAEQGAQRAPYRHRNVGKLLTRLQPRSLQMMPRKGSSGFREAWEIEDGVTIAGALGAVAARGPGPAFAVTVLCLRWWPEFVFGPETVKIEGVQQVKVRAGIGVDVMRSELLAKRQRTFRPALLPLLNFANRGFTKKARWSAMTEAEAKTVRRAIEEGRMVATLVDEYVHPNFCPTCHGYGQVFQLKDEQGRVRANPRLDCPDCIGSGHQPWGINRRAHSIGMRAETFHKHAAAPYAAVLGLFRGLESRAARALVRVLGD